jgi:NADPH-dependent curcumin reductase CurA
VASRADAVPVGATVSHFLGWREYAVLEAGHAIIVDTTLAPPQAYLNALGTTGLTAYVALTEVVPVKQGDVVFVSAAAGAVGSVAGQLARKLGASRVIGSAGGPAKAAKLVNDFGFDAAVDYKAGPVAGQLTDVAPDGIDIYVDQVGGDHLEAAIAALREHGRVALVGAISEYNAMAPIPGPSNLYQVAVKQLTLRGLLINSYLDRFPAWIERGAGWLADGSLRSEETVFEGIEQAPAAFLGVMRGANIGKMLVRLAS